MAGSSRVVDGGTPQARSRTENIIKRWTYCHHTTYYRLRLLTCTLSCNILFVLASKMKRAKESGASYRNKRKAKLENIKANEGALLKYVKSVVPETSDSTLGLSSSQTTGPSNPEQAEKVQDLETVNLVPVRSVDIIPEDQISITSTELKSLSLRLEL